MNQMVWSQSPTPPPPNYTITTADDPPHPWIYMYLYWLNYVSPASLAKKEWTKPTTSTTIQLSSAVGCLYRTEEWLACTYKPQCAKMTCHWRRQLCTYSSCRNVWLYSFNLGLWSLSDSSSMSAPSNKGFSSYLYYYALHLTHEQKLPTQHYNTNKQLY